MSGPKSKLKTQGDAVHGLRTGGLLLAGCLAGSAVAATVGAPVTIGAAADNSTIKMTFGSFTAGSGTPTAGGTWGVAYITPASTWGTTGAIDVTFQIFNPGATYLNQTTDNERIKAGDPIFFNLQSTATAGSEPYAAVVDVTTTANLASVTVPTVSTFTSTDTATTFGNYKGSYSASGGGGPGTFNFDVAASTDISAPSHTAGGGDIMSWRITPNGAGASAGDKIYVSDFYKTGVNDGSGNVVYAGFHLIGINSFSSWIGAKAGDIVYVTPEPSTWAAIIGLVGVVGWQVRSRCRSVAVGRELSRNSN
jgi:hypothetical protein